MLELFICEDDIKQRSRMEKIISNFIFIEELDIKIALSTENPQDILNYLQENPKTTGLYFLDVDLNHELTGIDLGAKIRELDITGNIVFVTTHGELSYLTFKYKIEAMDYIIKETSDEIVGKITSCIRTAIERYSNNRNPSKGVYTIKIGNRVMAYPHENILFIESSDIPHKLELHLKNGVIEYYGTLNEAEDVLPNFYRSHKSSLLNPKNVIEVNRSTKEVEFSNGDICEVSARKLKGLITLVGSLRES